MDYLHNNYYTSLDIDLEDYEDYVEHFDDSWVPSYDEYISYYRMYEQTYRDTCKILFSTFLFEVAYYWENSSDMTFEEYMDYWY